jgi:hypothetical protein
MMSAPNKASVVGAVLLAALLASGIASASAAVCKMRLRVELTPDVPVPLDSGFLSSLLSNRVSYRLTVLGWQPGSIIVTELAGPGPEYRCRNVVETMRRDGRILSIHLDRDNAMPPVSRQVPRRTLDLRTPDLESLDVAGRQPIGASSNSDEAEPVTIAAASLLAEEALDAQPSSGGFASLYWTARHPTQAWRIFLPLPVAADDLSPEISGRGPTQAASQALAERADIDDANVAAPITLAQHVGR